MGQTQSAPEPIPQADSAHKSTIVYSNGDRFEGTRKQGFRHGEGTFFGKNGDKYKGNWHKDRKNGSGEMHYHTGEFYKGGWKNNLRWGIGEYTDSEGSNYNGGWLNNKMHGDGIMQYPNFSEYRGRWKDGVKHGEGEFIENDKKVNQVFENGVLLKKEIPKDYWDISDEEVAPYRDSINRKTSSSNGGGGKNGTSDGGLGPETLSLENFRVNLKSLIDDGLGAKLITDWDASDVGGFLARQGMGEYGKMFNSNEINGKSLLKLTETDLLEIGVKSKGHRVTLRDSIDKLCQLSKAEIRDKLQKKFRSKKDSKGEPRIRTGEPRKRRKFNDLHHRDQMEVEKKISESGEHSDHRSFKKSTGSSKKSKEMTLKARSVSPNGKPRCHLAPPLSMEEKLVGYLEIIPKTIQEDVREVSESDDEMSSSFEHNTKKNCKSSSGSRTFKDRESINSKEQSKLAHGRKSNSGLKNLTEKKFAARGLDGADVQSYKFPRKGSVGELSPGGRATKGKTFQEVLANHSIRQKSSSDIEETEKLLKFRKKYKNSKSQPKVDQNLNNSPIRQGKTSEFSPQSDSPFDFRKPSPPYLFSPQKTTRSPTNQFHINSPDLYPQDDLSNNTPDTCNPKKKHKLSKLHESQNFRLEPGSLDCTGSSSRQEPDSDYLEGNSLEAQPSSKETDTDDPKDAEELKEKVNFVSRHQDSESSGSESDDTSVSESIINKLIIPDTDIELGKYLGSGTLGGTYFGWSYGQEVVIKKCQRGGVASFRRKVLYKKAKHYSECSHPNLVLFMGITIGTNEYSIISEYMKNKSLWHNLHEIKQQFSAQEKINLIEAVAKGMTYLHERDICHYSLKSQNILMDEGMTAKISDFGLRNYKHFGEDPDQPVPQHSEKFMVGTSSGNSMQTDNEYWICPEIFNGEKYDTKSDVYSFGVLMWEIISGQIPYKDYSKEKFAEVCRGPDSQLPELHNKAHPKLVSLVKKCMHKHPGSRPAFKNLLNEIQQLKTGICNNKTIIKELNMFFGPIQQKSAKKLEPI